MFERVFASLDLAERVAHVFRRVFVAIGLARDMAVAVVARFRDGFVWSFCFRELVAGIIGVGRFVAVRVG